MYYINIDRHVFYKTKKEAKRELKMFKDLGYEDVRIVEYVFS